MVEINNSNLYSKVLKIKEDSVIKNSVFFDNTQLYIFDGNFKVSVVDCIMDNVLITIENNILSKDKVCGFLNKIFRFENTVPENFEVSEDVLVLYKTKYVKGFSIMGCKFDVVANSFYID